jgi:hypothetical protein
MKQGFIEEKHAKLCISQNPTRMLRRSGPRIIRNGGRWIGNKLSGWTSVMSTSGMTEERFGSLMRELGVSVAVSGYLLWPQV